MYNHACNYTTVDYLQQIVYGNIVNQIHGFTIDFGKFILIVFGWFVPVLCCKTSESQFFIVNSALRPSGFACRMESELQEQTFFHQLRVMQNHKSSTRFKCSFVFPNGTLLLKMNVLAFETSSYRQAFTMFITAVCVFFFIKLKWPKNKNIYNKLRKYTGSAFANHQCVICFFFILPTFRNQEPG